MSLQQRVFKRNSAGFPWTSYFWGSVLLPFNLPTGYVKLLIFHLLRRLFTKKKDYFHEGISTETLDLLTIIVKSLNDLITDQILDDF